MKSRRHLLLNLVSLVLVEAAVFSLTFGLVLDRNQRKPSEEATPQTKENGGQSSVDGEAIDYEEDETAKSPWEINQRLKNLPIFEGDIVLDGQNLEKWTAQNRVEDRVRQTRKRRSRRATITSNSLLWPRGIVPYEIDPKIDPVIQTLIGRAMNHFMNHTCIRFRPKTERDVDYISYQYLPGCWSSVGRVGGGQVIAMSDDCDEFGVVVHETAHALGFWHEQSRPDRDRYVRVLSENIDPVVFTAQFSKKSDVDSWSRGYAYDYNSIMHYGPKDYSDNGKETIQLIGIGKKLGFKIGQRKRLSDIDIAQLNDMYNCHRIDADRKGCKEGWVKFRSSCYSFQQREPLSFYPASNLCRSQGSHLVIIDNEGEDHFLKTHLKNLPQPASKWLTGGIRLTPPGEFEWYHSGSEGNNYEMTYKAWPEQKEPDYTWASLVLAMVSKTRSETQTQTQTMEETEYEWNADDWGSKHQPQNHSYPFICESKSNTKCFDSAGGKGEDYRGHLAYTWEGITCQRWSRRYPHNHTIALDPSAGIGDHNFCRNPSGIRNRPWCYTLLQNVTWQYCDVPLCNVDAD